MLLLFAQTKEAIQEFKYAAETWGLANSVLMGTVIILVLGLICIALWLKPKLDTAISKHFELVTTLNTEAPKIKDEMHSVTAAVENMQESVDTLVAKVAKWPSDVDRVCHLRETLKKAGATEADIDRAVKFVLDQRAAKGS